MDQRQALPALQRARRKLERTAPAIANWSGSGCEIGFHSEKPLQTATLS